MNINVNKKAGRLYDLFASIFISCNTEYYYNEVENVNVKVDPEFKTLMNEAISILGNDMPKYKRYFGELYLASSLIDLDKIWELENLDEYLGYIETKTAYDIQKFILTLIDCVNEEWIYTKDEEQFKAILKDNNLLIEFLRDKPISNEEKWTAVEIINNIVDFKKQFINLTKDYEKKYTAFIKNHENSIENFYSQLELKVNEKGIDIDIPLLQMTDKREINTINLIPSYFHAYTTNQTLKKAMHTSYIIIGKYVDKLFDASNRDASTQTFVAIFKNLGDLNRYKFIKLLSQGERYGQEIADELNITSATVNYHANSLLISNLLTMERYENKTYYNLNKDTLRNLIHFIQKDLEL